MKNICTNIATLKLLPFDQTDKALAEYAELLYQRQVLPQFSRNNDKLDSYYFDTLRIDKNNNLAEVTKVILTLSHGQADVERGFSTNKDTVKTNQKS